jgi:hypothetical protein
VLAAGRTCSAVPGVLCSEAVASLEKDPTCADQANEHPIRDDDD